MTGLPLWDEWSTERAIKEGYKAHYALYAVVSDIADCIRSVPWRLYRKTGDKSEIVDQHPLSDMLRRPNERDNWGGLMESWDVHKSLAGNAYGVTPSLKEDNASVWMLRPDRMRPIPDRKGYIARWEYSVDGQTEHYKPEEVLHFKFYDPGHDYLGMAPLQAAAHLVDTSTAGIASNKALVNNLGRPAGMFNPDGQVPPMTEEQFINWEKAIKRQTTGKNRGKYLINPFAASFTQFEFTPVEMDYLSSFSTYENGIYKAFHVLPEAMGAESTYENKRWAIREKWNGPVNSRLREMRAVLNHHFGRVYGTSYPAADGEVYLDYDMTDTPAVAEMRKELIETAHQVWQMGVPWNVVDEEMGLGFGPQEGGESGYLPATMLPIGSAPAPEEEVRSDVLRAYWRATDRRKQGWERGVAEKVKDVFAAEGRAVAKAVKAGTLDLEPLIDARKADWETLISAVLRALIEDFGDQVDIQRRYTFDPWNDLIQKWVLEKTLSEVGYITDTTKRKLRRLVLAGIDEGISTAQLARRIEENYIDWANGKDQAFTSSRAYTIARTEVHSASGYAMHESARQSGVAKEKRWLDSGDDRVRDAHVTNTGAGWIPFDVRYPNGALYPGDGTDDINCRCVELYRTG